MYCFFLFSVSYFQMTTTKKKEEVEVSISVGNFFFFWTDLLLFNPLNTNFIPIVEIYC